METKERTGINKIESRHSTEKIQGTKTSSLKRLIKQNCSNKIGQEKNETTITHMGNKKGDITTDVAHKFHNLNMRTNST